VTRRGAGGAVEVVVVHRVTYGDWTFPKGKLHEGETEEEAALREVEEETSLRCRLGRELGSTRYHDSRGRPKTVRYWEMSVAEGELEPANEIDAARWSPLEEARALLTYERDVTILDLLE
jgi:8-oxo-dGTP diphosphatase